MFQNKHFNPNYTRISEGLKRGLGVGRGFDFSMQAIFWNNLFTGKHLQKQAKYLPFPNKNLTSWSINNAKIH